MSSAVRGQLAKLELMSTAELQKLWEKLTRGPVPQVSPKLLRLALAWEIQAKAQGGHSRETMRLLDQSARGLTKTMSAQPGTRLVREWQGRAHVVLVAENGGISWDGRSYRSLSEVARAITGTRWSGPAFFGLKRKAAA